MDPAEKPENPAAVKFGHEFTDHMLEIPWNYNKGWGRPLISPVHALKLHPGAKVLHYATEVRAKLVVIKVSHPTVSTAFFFYFPPGIYADRYIVFAFPFVHSYVCSFIILECS